MKLTKQQYDRLTREERAAYSGTKSLSDVRLPLTCLQCGERSQIPLPMHYHPYKCRMCCDSSTVVDSLCAMYTDMTAHPPARIVHDLEEMVADLQSHG